MKYDIYKSSNEFIPLDWQFADMVVRRCDGDDDLRLLAAMALCAVRNSHSCLDLAAWSSRPAGYEDFLPSPLSPEKWLTVAERHPSAISQDASSTAPLILDKEHKLLYLNRYRRYEESIANAIRSRNIASATATPFPQQLVENIRATGCPVLIVASKRDKVNQSELAKGLRDIQQRLDLDHKPLCVSALKKFGLDELWTEILEAIHSDAREAT